MMNWFWSIYQFFWNMLPDNCECCGGKKGGVRGNENIINGVITCDYCHDELRN